MLCVQHQHVSMLHMQSCTLHTHNTWKSRCCTLP
jgi:hypothetical protein